jgi:NAD(P)-dependent dehydrogenase (short-subunit alcohol dehydrogenase family)
VDEDRSVSKAALITGCSSGIGRATALRLAERGWRVYATARKPETIEDLAARGCAILPLDVTDDPSMQGAVDTIVRAEGAVGVLVNNAGYSQSGAAETVSMDLIRRQFETNVFGLIRLTQLVLPGMREQGWGRIVNVSSMGGRLTFPGGAYYHASKHAVEAFSDALRFEVRGFGVHAVVIEPGLIRTAFGEAAVSSMAEAHEDGPYASFNAEVSRLTKTAYDGPLARLGARPETVAKVIERAISSRRPRSRYRVGASARMMLPLRAILPDRGWDLFLRSQYPRPKKD